MEELLVSTAKLSLATAATARRVVGALEHSVLLPVKAAPVLEALAVGNMYREGKKARPEQWSGPPHWHIWAAVVGTLLKSEGVTAEARAVLQAHATTTTTPASLAGIVNVCMAKKTQEPTQARIIFQIDSAHRDLESAMLQALASFGGEVQRDAAPRGALERSIANCLINGYINGFHGYINGYIHGFHGYTHRIHGYTSDMG
jgi:hypothetical protein